MSWHRYRNALTSSTCYSTPSCHISMGPSPLCYKAKQGTNDAIASQLLYISFSIWTLLALHTIPMYLQDHVCELLLCCQHHSETPVFQDTLPTRRNLIHSFLSIRHQSAWAGATTYMMYIISYICRFSCYFNVIVFVITSLSYLHCHPSLSLAIPLLAQN